MATRDQKKDRGAVLRAGASRDALAEIAAGRVPVREAGLIAPALVPLPDRILPLRAGRAGAFTSQPWMQTATELRRAWVQARRRYRPFERDLAPRLLFSPSGAFWLTASKLIDKLSCMC